jgi:alpha-D-xyloside xylohydrolase
MGPIHAPCTTPSEYQPCSADNSTALYNEAVYEVLVKKRGADQACLFARSATTGTQRFPVHWGGDTDSTFDGLAETMRGGLSLGLSGFGYHSSDIGGFKAEGKGGNDATAPPPGTV